MGAPDTRGKGADGVEKRPVRGGIAGQKDYARDKLTNGSKTCPTLTVVSALLGVSAISQPPSWSIRVASTRVRNRAGS